jgi:hypothetical protein
MVTYRFFTLADAGEMLSSSRADHVTDAQARFQAALRLKPGQRVEVWRGATCIWEMSACDLAERWRQGQPPGQMDGIPQDATAAFSNP